MWDRNAALTVQRKIPRRVLGGRGHGRSRPRPGIEIGTRPCRRKTERAPGPGPPRGPHQRPAGVGGAGALAQPPGPGLADPGHGPACFWMARPRGVNSSTASSPPLTPIHVPAAWRPMTMLYRQRLAPAAKRGAASAALVRTALEDTMARHGIALAAGRSDLVERLNRELAQTFARQRLSGRCPGSRWHGRRLAFEQCPGGRCGRAPCGGACGTNARASPAPAPDPHSLGSGRGHGRARPCLT